MIYIILIVLIIIVIVYLRYQHFTELDTTSDAINNIVTLFNDDKMNIKNLNVTNDLTVNNKTTTKELINDMSDRFDTFETKLMKIIYPVNSVFISRFQYDLANSIQIKNTPLYYGTWEIIKCSKNTLCVLSPTKYKDEKEISVEYDIPKSIKMGFGLYPVYVYCKISL